MNRQKRIFAFHLLNDRSGSPKVLSQLLRHWTLFGRKVHLYTNQNKEGFLSEIEGVEYHHAWYKFRSNPWLRLIYYTISQFIIILKVWNKITKDDIVYINTVLPFGAAFVGKLKGAKVIYHIHESTINPKILKWFLLQMVKRCTTEIINVSKYVEYSHNLSTIPNHLVYNAIEQSYLDKVLPKIPTEIRQNVLMVCSLKTYKGVFEFVQLAQDHPMYSFRLVLNASQNEIDLFFKGHEIPINLTMYASQKDLHPFYQWADVILNLSRPNEWVETFGLTIIEGMAYGLPAIVPPVGGILEVIQEGVTGYAVDSRDREKLNKTLKLLLEDSSSHRQFSIVANKHLGTFSEECMVNNIDYILSK